MKNYEVPEIQDDIISLDAKTALRISKTNSREEFESILEKIKAAAEQGKLSISLTMEKEGSVKLLLDAGFCIDSIETPVSDTAIHIIKW